VTDGISSFWRPRLRLYGLLVSLGYAALVTIGTWWRWVSPEGSRITNDFVAFWSAGVLALGGRAAEAYDAALLRAMQVEAIGGPFEGLYFWLNPPTFFLAVTPFALLPHLLAGLLWVLVTAGFFVAMLRLIVPGFLVPALLAAPATLFCAMAGQNGFVTAGLMAGCLALLERRPVMAGLLLGLLTCKPQFGLLFPPILLNERRWATFAAATATTLALVGVSALLFGAGAWMAFLGGMDASRDLLLAGGAAWHKLQSPYAIAVQATGSLRVALGAQLATLAAMATLLVWLSLRRARPALLAASLAAASYLATPYAYLYDAVILTTAAAFLLKDGLHHGFGRFDRPLIVAGCLLPGSFLVLGSLAAPAGCLVLLSVAVRRAAARPG
jgi:hypothetical protein